MNRRLAIIGVILGAIAITTVIWTSAAASRWRFPGALAAFILAVLAINLAQAANTIKRSSKK